MDLGKDRGVGNRVALDVRLLSPAAYASRWKSIVGVILALAAFTMMVFAEGSAHVTGIEPAAGKVNDSATVSGENLGKSSVVAVFLSDEKADYKAALAEQSADKIAIKIPQVKPGDYNISIQVGNNIFIQPVRYKVQE